MNMQRQSAASKWTEQQQQQQKTSLEQDTHNLIFPPNKMHCASWCGVSPLAVGMPVSGLSVCLFICLANFESEDSFRTNVERTVERCLFCFRRGLADELTCLFWCLDLCKKEKRERESTWTFFWGEFCFCSSPSFLEAIWLAWTRSSFLSFLIFNKEGPCLRKSKVFSLFKTMLTRNGKEKLKWSKFV